MSTEQTNKKAALPVSRRGGTINLTPANAALARTVSSSISSATSITLNTNTDLIEITALNADVYMRYQAGVTSSNFDEFISAGSTRHYAIPDGVTVISVIERSATATVVIIEK